MLVLNIHQSAYKYIFSVFSLISAIDMYTYNMHKHKHRDQNMDREDVWTKDMYLFILVVKKILTFALKKICLRF